MDEVVYEALSKYYNTLENGIYVETSNVRRLLILSFYKDFVYEDYRGLLDKESYRLIEQALDCLYGTSCLISYPDYLKMGKLHLGEMTELSQRVKTIEDTEVVKLIHGAEEDPNSDILIVESEE